MKIQFFETNNGLDNRAIKSGVYQIELQNNQGQTIPLYIGESVWIAERCGQHLYALFNDPSYFGLEENDLSRDDLILKFTVCEEIKDKKSILGVGRYKEIELKYIKENNPLTQLYSSDRQISIEEKKNKVQNKMLEMGFK